MDILTELADIFNYKEYEGDMDEKQYGLAIMMILEDFCKKYNSKSYSYIEKHFDDDCKKLEEKLLKENNKQFEKYEKGELDASKLTGDARRSCLDKTFQLTSISKLNWNMI